MREPQTKRAVAFVDGQNLFRHAKDAFGHIHPNYDLVKLHRAICEQQGWQPAGIRFYTGIPKQQDDAFWHGYWERRLLAMKRSGIETITRYLRKKTITFESADGQRVSRTVFQEKGIDVRLALDVIRMARKALLDVAVIYSQDQDLAEVAREIRDIAREQDRWIKIASAFPHGKNSTAWRGIDGTDWIRISEDLYNACLDPRDYRPGIS